MNVDVVYSGRAELAEGPVWHDGYLWWVNITSGTLNRLDTQSGLNASRTAGCMLGAAVPCEQSGKWLLATHRGIILLDWKTGEQRILAHPESDMPRNRFNDGKCDPAGRFWAGTLNLDDAKSRCALYMLERDLSVTKKISLVQLSNGLGWSPDAETFYYIDTLTQTIQAFDYDARSGNINNQRVLVDTRSTAGFPDGMTVDADCNLWVAFWGGHHVVCFDGKTGKKLERIQTPVSQPSSCTFGGPNLDELYITSAWQGMNDQQRQQEPLAGAIMRCTPGVKGLPVNLFGSGVEISSTVSK